MKLEDARYGQWVKYGDKHGRIKSTNHKYIFVVFSCDKWNEFGSFTAQACRPEDIELSLMDTEDKEMLDCIDALAENLTDWEIKLISDLIDFPRELSIKQRETLQRIYEERI